MARAFIDDYGIHVPDYPTVLEDVKNDMRGIYGLDLYLEPDSQEGQLCAAFATRMYDCYTLAQSVYNSYSPHTAQGVGLSSVVKTNGIARQPHTFSQVSLRIIGQGGTEIRNGIVADQAGQRWLLPAYVKIPLEGELFVTALAENPGDVRGAAGEITTIVTRLRGWQAVINPQAAIPGYPVEDDWRLRRRQSISTALPSRSIFDGTEGAVAQLPNVTRWRAYENDTSLPDVHGIPPHSICFVVEGGNEQEIGDTMALKKGPGCGTFGDVYVETRDTFGVPNIINFFRPLLLPVAVEIRIKPLPGYVATTAESIRQNLFAYINAVRIGDDLLISKLYNPINTAEPVTGQRTFDVTHVLIGPHGAALAQVNYPVAFNAVVLCAMDDIAVLDYPV